MYSSGLSTFLMFGSFSYLAFSSPISRRQQDFLQSECGGSFSLSGSILSATCDSVASSVDLNTCLENVGGVLQFAPNGNFINQCFDCSLVAPFAVLTCNCAQGDGTNAPTSINLDGSEVVTLPGVFVQGDNTIGCNGNGS
ncbi:hypothetical protein N431DRAFT_452483 [Stipitochalara longipes BDJ]|nr:hypothetical protein N431DRAFT_452483 [Stipitochalara longipes BDJ]